MTRATVLCIYVCVSAPLRADDSVDFSRDIRPILSDRCFSCHGPDDQAREADLRLDVREDALRNREGTRVIVPGNPGRSEFVRRILSDDPDEQMPPPDSNKLLSQEDRALLIRWIELGAEYSTHWAFVPPKRPRLVPMIASTTVPTTFPSTDAHPIDFFVMRMLMQKGTDWELSPEADAYTLVRRVYLDLIGLPPTPGEADEWVAKIRPEGSHAVDPAAWGKLVDHLIGLPQYGERWARRWLDLARYSDTNGYEKDRDRSMWPYRDWVVNALNDDMPFDQFTIEQLAGDMLPDATISQRIATGFHRNTMLNEEGGIDPLEFRFYAMTDRVATTGTTWLGLTLECVQCHSHKYDPVSHTEYYGLMAFLNNADEPDLDIPDSASEERYARNLAEADRLLKQLPDQWPNDKLEESFQQWLDTERQRTSDWQPLRPTKATSNLPLLTVEDDDAIYASGDSTKHDIYQLEFEGGFEGATAIRLEALPDARLPAHGPGMTFYEGRKGDFFLSEFQVRVGEQPVRVQRATHSYAKNQFGKNPVSAALATDGDVQTGWSTNGRNGERHVAVFTLSEPLPESGTLSIQMDFGRHFSSSLGRFRVSVTTDDGPADARDLPSETERLLAIPDEQLTKADRGRLLDEFLLRASEVKQPAARIAQLRKRPGLTTSLVLQERPPANPRPTFRHHRGEFLQTREQVEPLTPEALHAFPDSMPRTRLGLARWLVSPENPLTSRVVVNRHWAAFFGNGLVGTLNDFGLQGESPSHPQLLDWLAVEFSQGGEMVTTPWSIKQLHRVIVTSQTYRQTSRVTPELLKRDADNRLLTRAPRFRLEAEIIRDASLKAAGILSTKSGGPPVKPPQPAGVSEAAYGRPKWSASQGEDRRRRSLYTYQKRTAPFAMFLTFDGPSGESCVARRDVSNTSLQALTLLNDEMFIETAQAFGKSLAGQEVSDVERITDAFRRILTRPPSDDEAEALMTFVIKQRERIDSGELDAEVISGSKADNRNDSAVWTLLTRALLSVDETMTRN